jgi:hypothetical protein
MEAEKKTMKIIDTSINQKEDSPLNSISYMWIGGDYFLFGLFFI